MPFAPSGNLDRRLGRRGQPATRRGRGRRADRSGVVQAVRRQHPRAVATPSARRDRRLSAGAPSKPSSTSRGPTRGAGERRPGALELGMRGVRLADKAKHRSGRHDSAGGTGVSRDIDERGPGRRRQQPPGRARSPRRRPRRREIFHGVLDPAAADSARALGQTATAGAEAARDRSTSRAGSARRRPASALQRCVGVPVRPTAATAGRGSDPPPQATADDDAAHDRAPEPALAEVDDVARTHGEQRVAGPERRRGAAPRRTTTGEHDVPRARPRRRPGRAHPDRPLPRRVDRQHQRRRRRAAPRRTPNANAWVREKGGAGRRGRARLRERCRAAYQRRHLVGWCA
jgi:hypothetical protein